MKWIDELRRLLRRARTQGAPSHPWVEGEPGGITCEDAARRVFEWLDGELDPDMEGRVGDHLKLCARCYPFLHFEEAFREALRRAGARPVVPPPGLDASVRASLRAAGFSGTAREGEDEAEAAGEAEDG